MIHLIIEGNIAEGKTEECRKILDGLVTATRNHDGVVSYEFFINDDGRLHGLERYQDANAIFAHMEALGPNALDPLMATLSAPPKMVAVGEVTDELKAAFGPMGVTFGSALSGFAR